MKTLIDFVKKLNISIKILMVTLALSVLIIIIGIALNVLMIIIGGIACLILSTVIIVFLFAFQQKKKQIDERKLVSVISEEIKKTDGISLVELSKKFCVPENNVRRAVFVCIKDGLIDGYTLFGERVELMEFIDVATEIVTCIGCGATYISKKSIKKCPFCGRFNV